MTENATIDAPTGAPAEVDLEELRTSGLRTPGWYLVEFAQCKEKHFSGTSQKTGEPYNFSKISYLMRLHERAIYEPIINENGENTGKGMLSNERETLNPRTDTKFKDFATSGKGLVGLNNAYRAVTGQVPQGTGKVPAIHLADELKGHKAWAKIFWAEDKNDPNAPVRDMFTNEFRSLDYGPPATAQVPRD